MNCDLDRIGRTDVSRLREIVTSSLVDLDRVAQPIEIWPVGKRVSTAENSLLNPTENANELTFCIEKRTAAVAAPGG